MAAYCFFKKKSLHIQCKMVMHFSFNFGWYSIQLDIVHEELGVEGFLLHRGNLLS